MTTAIRVFLGLIFFTAGMSKLTQGSYASLALGANAARVIRDVLRGALGQTLVGLVIGIPAALAAVTVVGSFLYQVEARDPRVIAVATIVLVASAAVAGIGPARRASRINPIEAIKD